MTDNISANCIDPYLRSSILVHWSFLTRIPFIDIGPLQPRSAAATDLVGLCYGHHRSSGPALGGPERLNLLRHWDNGIVRLVSPDTTHTRMNGLSLDATTGWSGLGLRRLSTCSVARAIGGTQPRVPPEPEAGRSLTSQSWLASGISASSTRFCHLFSCCIRSVNKLRSNSQSQMNRQISVKKSLSQQIEH